MAWLTTAVSYQEKLREILESPRDVSEVAIPFSAFTVETEEGEPLEFDPGSYEEDPETLAIRKEEQQEKLKQEIPKWEDWKKSIDEWREKHYQEYLRKHPHAPDSFGVDEQTFKSVFNTVFSTRILPGILQRHPELSEYSDAILALYRG